MTQLSPSLLFVKTMALLDFFSWSLCVVVHKMCLNPNNPESWTSFWDQRFLEKFPLFFEYSIRICFRQFRDRKIHNFLSCSPCSTTNLSVPFHFSWLMNGEVLQWSYIYLDEKNIQTLHNHDRGEGYPEGNTHTKDLFLSNFKLALKVLK